MPFDVNAKLNLYFLYMFLLKCCRSAQTTPVLCSGYFGNCDKLKTRRIQLNRSTEIVWRFLYLFIKMISFKTDYSYFMPRFLVDLKTAINRIKVRFNLFYSILCISNTVSANNGIWRLVVFSQLYCTSSKCWYSMIS